MYKIQMQKTEVAAKDILSEYTLESDYIEPLSDEDVEAIVEAVWQSMLSEFREKLTNEIDKELDDDK